MKSGVDTRRDTPSGILGCEAPRVWAGYVQTDATVTVRSHRNETSAYFILVIERAQYGVPVSIEISSLLERRWREFQAYSEGKKIEAQLRRLPRQS
jgi:hypothetical protein